MNLNIFVRCHLKRFSYIPKRFEKVICVNCIHTNEVEDKKLEFSSNGNDEKPSIKVKM